MEQFYDGTFMRSNVGGTKLTLLVKMYMYVYLFLGAYSKFEYQKKPPMGKYGQSNSMGE